MFYKKNLQLIEYGIKLYLLVLDKLKIGTKKWNKDIGGF